MAFGFSYGGGGGGDFLPTVKYDARAGRVFRVDREDGVSVPHDVTRNLKMVVDFENLAVGWIMFAAGTAPNFNLVPFGSPFPPRPSDQHKQGICLTVKLSKECGGDVRELAGTSAVMMRGFDELHSAYIEGEKQNPGKLPVVVLKDTIPVTSGSGAKASTNYQPVFEIVGWVGRPNDMTGNPRLSQAAAPAAAPAATTARSAPPSTGSSVAPPPAARSPAPEMAGADDGEEDFG